MRAILLYAAGMADAVIEGKASVPTVAVGEDEFVELDEAGQPRKKAARARQRPQAAVRKKAPPRRRVPQVKTPAETGDEMTAEFDDLDEAESAGAATTLTTTTATPGRRSGGGGGAGRRKRGDSDPGTGGPG
jgi:hypothetical protein